MIGVIVPVFNAEKYLPHCIESVIAQTYPNWELLLVDDGSRDTSLAICSKYAKLDSRIKVFHKTNGGPGDARNYGIDNSLAECLCFIDSDDWIEPSYLEQFHVNDNNEDLLIQGMIQEKDNKEVERKRLSDKKYERDIFSNAIRDNNLMEYGSPCCKLFRKTILQRFHIRFPIEYQCGEDTVFFLRYLSRCQNLRCLPYEGYHYLRHGIDSLSGKTHPSISLFHFLLEENTIYASLLSSIRDLDLLNELNERHVLLAKRGYINMFRLKYEPQEKIRLMEDFSKQIRPLLSMKHLSLHDRTFLFLACLPGHCQHPFFYLLYQLGIIQAQ